MSAIVPSSSAEPLYAQGQLVGYRDHHKRWQEGEVLAIEATWNFGRSTPLIIYTLRHPSYAGRRTYASESSIVRAIHRKPIPTPTASHEVTAP